MSHSWQGIPIAFGSFVHHGSAPATLHMLGLPPSVSAALLQFPETVQRFLKLSAKAQSRASAIRDCNDLAYQLACTEDYVKGLVLGRTDGNLGSLSSTLLRAAAVELLSLRDGAVGLALIQLVAAAVRLPLDPDESRRHVAGELPPYLPTESIVVHASCIVGYILAAENPAGKVASFAGQLLATQALQASARQLHAVEVSPLRTASAQGRALMFVLVATNVADGVASYASHVVTQPGHPSFPADLRSALRESLVLERISRVLLRLLQLPRNDKYSELWVLAAVSFINNYSKMSLNTLGPADPPLPAQLEMAASVSGPCADFAAMALGLATLCAADGGPSYGLPQEVMDRVPPLATRGGVPVSMSGAPNEFVSPPVPGALAVAVQHSVRAGRLSSAAGLKLLLRVARLAVASCPLARSCSAMRSEQGAATEQGEPAAAVQQPLAFPRLPLQPQVAATVTLKVLTAARELKPVARAKTWQGAVGEWWQLLVGLTWAVREPVVGDTIQLGQLGWLLAEPMMQADTSPLVPEPHPEVAAALAHGYLPTLERLVRRAGSDPRGSESLAVENMAWRVVGAGSPVRLRFLGALLAHGDSRQAAALVVSVGKALHRAADGDCGHLQELAAGSLSAAYTLVTSMAGAAGPLSSAALPGRFLSVLSFAALKWLPALSRRTVKAKRPSVLSAWSVTSWIALLMAAAVGPVHVTYADGSSTAAGADSGAATSSGAATPAAVPDSSTPPVPSSSSSDGGHDCASAGWRRVLLEEMDPVGLLGVAARMALDPDTLNDQFLVSKVCLAFAAFFPEVVRSATIAAIAGAAAAAGAGSNAGGTDPQPARDVAGALPWPPAVLREIAVKAQARGEGVVGAGIEALASLVELWASGAEAPLEESCFLGQVRKYDWVSLHVSQAMTRLLVSPDEARTFLGGPTCSNPHCAGLPGDSELGVRLQRCGRCGAVEYCCRECQTAHWRAGHKEECGGRAG